MKDLNQNVISADTIDIKLKLSLTSQNMAYAINAGFRKSLEYDLEVLLPAIVC